MDRLPTRYVGVGECMVEIASGAADACAIGHGGDTFNTAAYLARWGWDVRYLTALGVDPFSRRMREAWTRDGVDLSLTLTHPDRLPGLYAISTAADGERSFHYWRDRSAARALFDLPDVEAALHEAARADLFQLSGVTLSLFGPAARDRLRAVAAAVAARGGTVVFDPNYRPAGWANPDEARDAFAALAPVVSVVLPSFDDERTLWGDADASTTIDRWVAMGASQVVVKAGAAGAWLRTEDGDRLMNGVSVAAVDTSGAGDAFNAAFLAASESLPPEAAVQVANRFAGLSVLSRGAILPRERMPALRGLTGSESGDAEGRLDRDVEAASPEPPDQVPPAQS